MLVGSHLFFLVAENSKNSIEYRKNNEFKNKVLLELINGFKFNSSLKCVSKCCILISALVKRYSEYKQTFLKNFKVRLIDKIFFCLQYSSYHSYPLETVWIDTPSSESSSHQYVTMVTIVMVTFPVYI